MPPSALRNSENDRGFPGLHAAARLAEALGVPVERLAEGWRTRLGMTQTGERAGGAGEANGHT